MKKVIEKKVTTGTREWSDVSHNIGIGCSHGCLYCYAGAKAIEREVVGDSEDWLTERTTPRRIPGKEGVVMFPTAHDITPFYLDESLKTIRQMMLAGREILIVTKAHLECMTAICSEIKSHEGYYEKVLIRVTIGSINEDICKIWEPGAPSPQERIEALKYAFLNILRTSVSVEPMLQGPLEAAEVYNEVEKYCSEDIWFGKMNSLNVRLVDAPGKKDLIKLVHDEQCDKNILALYDALKWDPKVKWKDSIRAVIEKNSK